MALIETFDKSLWHRPQSFNDYYCYYYYYCCCCCYCFVVNKQFSCVTLRGLKQVNKHTKLESFILCYSCSYSSFIRLPVHKITERLPFNTDVTFLLVLARNLDFLGTCCLEIFNVTLFERDFSGFLRRKCLGVGRSGGQRSCITQLGQIKPLRTEHLIQ